MSTLSSQVSLTITVDSLGVARAGFGTALVVSHTATWLERSRTYTDLAGVTADFDAGTPEYIAASALFAQSPHPEQIIIGRAALAPTQVYEIDVSSVVNSTKYAVNVIATGATASNPLTYTSDSSATNDEIVAGLVTALNGVSSKNYTAAATGTAGSQVVTVTATAAADWFSIEILDPTLLAIKQTHTDPGIATDLAAIQVENDTWYALHTMYNSKAYVLAAAAWIETQSKIYLVDVNETQAITVAVGSSPTDTLYALFALTYNRTAGSYYPSPAAMFSAAWLGRVLPDDPGSATWKFKTLAGIAAVNLTSTHETNLRARKANCYETIAGVNKTWEGTVAGGTFGFIDTTRGLDWLSDDMTKGVYGAMSGSEKVPYTNAGLALVRNEIKASLKRAFGMGIINDDYVIEMPSISSISSSDKALRRLPNVKWSASLQGAIHEVVISAVVSTGA